MKGNIMIKSFPNGITLYLNSQLDMPQLLEEVAEKFQQSRNFFRDAKMALCVEGRVLQENEERQLIQTIQDNSDLQIVCIVGKNEETNKKFVKAIQKVDMQYAGNFGRFYKGTLKNGQKIEAESSMVILGDVYPGCAVTSTKDIIIIGGLYGEVHAGFGGEEGHYIVALEMSPEKMKIGDFRYRPKEKPKWGIKPKVQPKIAYVKDSHIVMEPITKELLEFLPF
ncbi:MAG: septum site-determining protein MinC [Lachnospiraceae bacterium]|nr:septum site-determining protein MinC [Lachnospiraceae bacterium]MDD7027110.1 septum site-determining protein MinC [Lachnospiraceae bacterium]MDY5700179.1 septum site-determining protein MinC [Lachnospiraceae bacterium]